MRWPLVVLQDLGQIVVGLLDPRDQLIGFVVQLLYFVVSVVDGLVGCDDFPSNFLVHIDDLLDDIVLNHEISTIYLSF